MHDLCAQHRLSKAAAISVSHVKGIGSAARLFRPSGLALTYSTYYLMIPFDTEAHLYVQTHR